MKDVNYSIKPKTPIKDKEGTWNLQKEGALEVSSNFDYKKVTMDVK